MRKGGWLDETTKCKASISSGRSVEKRQASKIDTGNKVMRDKNTALRCTKTQIAYAQPIEPNNMPKKSNRK